MAIISTKYLLQDAQEKGYAIPAFNIHNAETIQAILEVCSELRSPVILAGTPGTFKHIAFEEIYALCEAYSASYDIPWLFISIIMKNLMISAAKSTRAYAAQ